MTALRWSSPDQRFIVTAGGDAVAQLLDLLQGVGASETGGILIGRYDDEHRVASIQEIAGPPLDSLAGHSWFLRGIQHLTDLLRMRWERTHRTYYLGEWHFHPTLDVLPSDTDIKAMTQISEDDEFRCPEPIMFLIGLATLDGQRRVRIFVYPRGKPAVELFGCATIARNVGRGI